MMKNFWKSLSKPILCLAPMADVTDVAFRRIIAMKAKPTVIWTEFVSCEALCHNEISKKKAMIDLMFDEIERPIVAQLFGSKPHQFFECAKLLHELGFDGIDINMGCPDKNVCKQGSGSSLMLNHKLAQEIIKECKRGANGLPVSVKTRIGYDEIDYIDWFQALIDVEPDAITIHGRTRKEMSLVPAHWDIIGEIGSFIRSKSSNSIIIGNGDVMTINEAKEKCKKYNLDGIMMGRSIFGNPWLFQDSSYILSNEERLNGLVEHSEIYQQLLADPKYKSFKYMRKSFKSYTRGLPGSKRLNLALSTTKNAQEVSKVIQEYKNYLKDIQKI